MTKIQEITKQQLLLCDKLADIDMSILVTEKNLKQPKYHSIWVYHTDIELQMDLLNLKKRRLSILLSMTEISKSFIAEVIERVEETKL